MRTTRTSAEVAAFAVLSLLGACGPKDVGIQPVQDGSGPGFGGNAQVGHDAGSAAGDATAPTDAGSAGSGSGADTGTTPGGPVGTGPCADASDCNDHNTCTDDVCAGGTCYHTNNTAPCSDGDACTVDDACWKGTCTGTPLLCDDGDPCTEDACADGACYAASISADKGCAPAISVASPTRGATLSGPGPVQVAGSVILPGGPLASFTLNGATVAVDAEGSFSTTVTPSVGVNLLRFVAKGKGGATATASQSFAWAPTLHTVGTSSQLTVVDGSSGLWLGKELFDDDDPQDLDDLSALAWLLLDTFDVNKAIPSPLFAEGQEPSFGWCKWDVKVSKVDYEVGDVDVLPVPGAIRIHATLTGFKAWFEAVASWCPDALGWVYADAVTLDAELSVVVTEGGSIDVDLLWVDVVITGVNVDAQKGSASLFNWLINWFEDDLAAKLETELEKFIPDKIVPLVDGVLSGFASFKTTIPVPALVPSAKPVSVGLDVRAGQVGFASAGATFHLKAGAGAAKASSHVSPGTIARGACGASGNPTSCVGQCGGQAPGGCYCDADCVKFGDCCTDACKACGQCLVVPPAESCGGKCGDQAQSGCYCDADCMKYGDCCADACDKCGHCKGDAFVPTPLPKQSPVELFVHEDLLNQLLFAVWWAGGLDLTLTDATVPAVTGMGISNMNLKIDLSLPPIVTTCTKDGKPEIQAGDVRATGTFNLLGTAASMDVFATAILGVTVGVTPAPGGGADLSFTLNGLRELEAQVISADGLGPDGPELIASLLDEATIQTLLGDKLSTVLAAWPLPQIDLAKWVPGLPPGAQILFVPKSVSHNQGAVILSGAIKGP